MENNGTTRELGENVTISEKNTIHSTTNNTNEDINVNHKDNHHQSNNNTVHSAFSSMDTLTLFEIRSIGMWSTTEMTKTIDIGKYSSEGASIA